MITCYDIVKNLIRTEKGTMLEADRQYLFQVAKSANKIEIKHAIEEIYKVKVASVNTMNIKGKEKRVRYEAGRTSAWKKAVITLKEGYKIEVT
ncbi:MAG: 50S ribosomal protein L23 [Candidatus Omnitrophica bacterium]|nr:50S ribosomal protein L23 [Candidatus Omnitrophota bacterium]